MKKNLAHEASAEHATPPHEQRNRPALAPELKAAWVKALRSGEFKQARNVLHDEVNGAYCCLGVLSKCRGQMDAGLCYPEEMGEELQMRFIGMNDIELMSFAQIADYIEANL